VTPFTQILVTARRRAQISAVLMCVTFAAALSAASPQELKHKPWVEKDWTKWSEWDCYNTLHYSPWVNFDEGAGREYGPSDVSGVGQHFYGFVQLLSALPLRQEKLRQLQLQRHYDRMNTQEKEAFDQQHSGDLVEGDGDSVRIEVVHNMFVRDYSDPGIVDSVFPPRKAALKLSDGTLVMPTGTTIYNQSVAEYVFPRELNGIPIYTSTDKVFLIVFGEVLPLEKKNLVKLGPQKLTDFHYDADATSYSFQIADMMYKGKLEY
jgi:hypothetical protein